MKKYKCMEMIGVPIVVIFTSVIMLGTYWLIYPYKTFELNRGIETITHEVVAGEGFEYYMDYCKYTDKEETISSAMVNGIIYHKPIRRDNTPKGCHTVKGWYGIPETLPKGEYYIKVILTYQVNPIRKEKVEFKSDTFIVK